MNFAEGNQNQSCRHEARPSRMRPRNPTCPLREGNHDDRRRNRTSCSDGLEPTASHPDETIVFTLCVRRVLGVDGIQPSARQQATTLPVRLITTRNMATKRLEGLVPRVKMPLLVFPHCTISETQSI